MQQKLERSIRQQRLYLNRFLNPVFLACMILMLPHFVSSVPATEIIKDTSLTRTGFWNYYTSTESDIQMTYKFGATGCTVSVTKSGAHEWESAIQQAINIKKNMTYTMKIVASGDSSDNVTASFKQGEAPWMHYAARSISLKPVPETFTFTWVNSGPDAVEASALITLALGKLKGTCIISKIAVTERDTTSGDINDFACLVPSKKQVITGAVAALPKGFVVFSKSGYNSIYISELNKWNPIALPGITSSCNTFSISDDGRWILYMVNSNSYIVRIDGKYKTRVPSMDYHYACGFLRSGPYGPEVFYMTQESGTMLAVQVAFNDTSVTFGTQRVLAKLGSDYEFDYYNRVTISKDQIWTRINPFFGDTVSKERSGFLTIPDSGRGIATSANVYKFKNDDHEEMFGCNHAMTHDGKYCVGIPGTSGETGNLCHCSPSSHKGFYVTRFYHDTDSMVENRDHVTRYAYSLNWCPEEYRFGEWSEVDFGNYYFTNNNAYLVATQGGTLSPHKGVWAINWENNTWYSLSPREDTVTIRSVAGYIGDYDTKLLASIIPGIDTAGDTSSNNPFGYKILKPAGVELFHPGDLCTLRVTSKMDGNAAVKLQFGKQSFNLLSRAINPRVDSVLVITIPEYFLSSKISAGVVKTDTIRPYSTECKIVLIHYTAGINDPVYSDGYFTIASSIGVRNRAMHNKYRQFTATSKSTINDFIVSQRSHTITQFTVYDLMGRAIVRWNLLSGQPFPYSRLNKFNDRSIYIIKFIATVSVD